MSFTELFHEKQPNLCWTLFDESIALILFLNPSLIACTQFIFVTLLLLLYSTFLLLMYVMFVPVTFCM